MLKKISELLRPEEFYVEKFLSVIMVLDAKLFWEFQKRRDYWCTKKFKLELELAFATDGSINITGAPYIHCYCRSFCFQDILVSYIHSLWRL
jgi:hypothetical protein